MDAQRMRRIDVSAAPAARIGASPVAVLLRGSSMRVLEAALAGFAILTALLIGMGR